MTKFIASYVTGKATRSVLEFATSVRTQSRVLKESLNREVGVAFFRVEVPSEGRTHSVGVYDFDKPRISARCDCPLGQQSFCHHKVLALWALAALIDSNGAPQVSPGNLAPQAAASKANPHLVRMAVSMPLNLYDLQRKVVFPTGRYYANAAAADAVALRVTSQGCFEAAFRDPNAPEGRYHITADFRDPKEMVATCSCTRSFQTLCPHLFAAIRQAVAQYGPNLQADLRGFEEEKEALVAQYGYTLAQPEVADKFDFVMAAGRLHLLLKDPTLTKLNAFENWEGIASTLFPEAGTQAPAPQPDRAKGGSIIYVLRVQRVLSQAELVEARQRAALSAGMYELDGTRPNYLPMLSFSPAWVVRSDAGKLTGRLREISLEGRQSALPLDDLAAFSALDMQLVQEIRNLEPIELSRAMAQLYPDLNLSGSNYLRQTELPPAAWHAAQALVGERLGHLLARIEPGRLFLQTGGDAISRKSITEISLLPARLILSFVLGPHGGEDFYALQPMLGMGDIRLPYLADQHLHYWLYRLGPDKLGMLDRQAARTLDYFREKPLLRLRANQLEGFVERFLIDLMNHHEVEIDAPIEFNEATGHLVPRLYLRDAGPHVAFIPALEYRYLGEAREVELRNRSRQIALRHNGSLTVVLRDQDREAAFADLFLGLHPRFQEQLLEGEFRLSVPEMLEGEWFFAAFERLKAAEVEVLGFSDLKNVRYNANRANISVRASSGIDWFDLKIEISFGEQFVSLKDVRKAILNKQHYVRLGDGTLGMLPQEWVGKYAHLLRMGDLRDERLRLSERQIGLMDGVMEELENQEALYAFWQKKQQLKNYREIPNLPVPPGIRAELRSYQQAGFNWLGFLHQVGWGGILADDMGLGKTLQAITFLQWQVDSGAKFPSLVVVPKSLIFNWQEEIRKFAPQMTFVVYHGPGRKAVLKEMDSRMPLPHIVLSTYGTVRADIAEFKGRKWHYLILDESQAIKNPDAQAARAVKLIPAHNRLALTGTPIENNTFDLFSQMDFLNPNMLGAADVFKQEFANAIDRDKDPEATARLRKLVYPFILRRTKEEVAKDLPEKIETVLYCEMGPAQRAVYDTFKDHFRQIILGKIDAGGMHSAGAAILEGLLRLRQICDSPRLLTDAEYTHESAKLDELLPRIFEDAGRHKILVFSQFLEMLEMVRVELARRQIRYELLTGATENRHEKVRTFQEQDDCRVFLMSLKAGGVGLNLTAADYVYLVDPWWNPAVEQQAIDRTHRIGQDKPVFAYKLICTGTVEEKILELQARKKAVAQDLIHNEAGFLKHLTREDVVSLFA